MSTFLVSTDTKQTEKVTTLQNSITVNTTRKSYVHVNRIIIYTHMRVSRFSLTPSTNFHSYIMQYTFPTADYVVGFCFTSGHVTSSYLLTVGIVS